MEGTTYNLLLNIVNHKIDALLQQSLSSKHGYSDPLLDIDVLDGAEEPLDGSEGPQSWDYKVGYTYTGEVTWLQIFWNQIFEKYDTLPTLTTGTTIYNLSHINNWKEIKLDDIFIRLQTDYRAYIPYYSSVSNNIYVLTYKAQSRYYTSGNKIWNSVFPHINPVYYSLNCSINQAEQGIQLPATYILGSPILLLPKEHPGGWEEELNIDVNYTIDMLEKNNQLIVKTPSNSCNYTLLVR